MPDLSEILTRAQEVQRQTRFDDVSAFLREHEWTPAHATECGCWPSALCKAHAELRAVEHYHPELIPPSRKWKSPSERTSRPKKSVF